MTPTDGGDSQLLSNSVDRTDLIALTRTLRDVKRDAAARAPISGIRFGRYRILEPIGRGGMGSVHLAEQIEPVSRQVAIKVMTLGRFSPELRLRFEIERQSLARMNHPGIAQIFDAGTTPEGDLFFVMEYVVGEAFDDWCHSPGVPVEQRVRILRDACRAVAHAHTKGILHCDLKPSNLLVAEIDGKPFVKLIDFGIAYSIGEGRHEAAGTPGYMSPEQFGSEGIDTRSDVFSLGVLLFEAVSSQRFRQWAKGDQIALDEARQRVGAEEKCDARFVRGPLGRARARELEAIVDRALARDRERRYAGADALADDLDRWLTLRPVLAAGQGATYVFSCFVRRQALLSAALLMFALVSALLVWRLALQLSETRRERDTADQVTGLLLATFDAADPYAHPGGSLSVRDLLRSAAERIGQREVEPSVRLRVLRTLGEVQTRLELFADAQATLASAVAIADTGATGWAERQRLELARIQAALNDEQFDAANGALSVALGEIRAQGDNRLLIDALIVLAEIGQYTENLDAATAALFEAQPLLATTTDGDLRFRWLRQSGRIAWARDEGVIASEHLQRAYELATRLYGAQDLRTLDTLSDLALAVGQAGDHDASERYRREIAEHTEAIWGEDSPGLATALSNLGALLQRRGGDARLREAVALARRAHDINLRMLGADSMDTALAANNFANALGMVGEHAAAEPLHAAAVRGLEASLGGAHSHLGIALNNHARNLVHLGRAAEAGPLVERAGAILGDSIGREHPRYAVWQLTRGEWLLASGDAAAARRQAEAAQPLIESSFAADSAEVGRMRLLLAAVGG